MEEGTSVLIRIASRARPDISVTREVVRIHDQVGPRLYLRRIGTILGGPQIYLTIGLADYIITAMTGPTDARISGIREFGTSPEEQVIAFRVVREEVEKTMTPNKKTIDESRTFLQGPHRIEIKACYRSVSPKFSRDFVVLNAGEANGSHVVAREWRETHLDSTSSLHRIAAMYISEVHLVTNGATKAKEFMRFEHSPAGAQTAYLYIRSLLKEMGTYTTEVNARWTPSDGMAKNGTPRVTVIKTTPATTYRVAGDTEGQEIFCRRVSNTQKGKSLVGLPPATSAVTSPVGTGAIQLHSYPADEDYSY